MNAFLVVIEFIVSLLTGYGIWRERKEKKKEDNRSFLDKLRRSGL